MQGLHGHFSIPLIMAPRSYWLCSHCDFLPTFGQHDKCGSSDKALRTEMDVPTKPATSMYL